jgi:hypothetical protein
MLLGILRVPDSETTDVEKAHTECQYPLASQPSLAKILRDSPSQFRESTPEFNQVCEFFLVPLLPPFIVVPVLSSSRGIRADGLNMSIWPGTDPYGAPIWRNGARAEIRSSTSRSDTLSPAGLRYENSRPRRWRTMPQRRGDRAAISRGHRYPAPRSRYRRKPGESLRVGLAPEPGRVVARTRARRGLAVPPGHRQSLIYHSRVGSQAAELGLWWK